MTILVCDDDKEIVEAVSIYLKQEGYDIIAAYNGKEALKVMQEKEIHLVILDIMMPNWIGSCVIKVTGKKRGSGYSAFCQIGGCRQNSRIECWCR